MEDPAAAGEAAAVGAGKLLLHVANLGQSHLISFIAQIARYFWPN